MSILQVAPVLPSGMVLLGEIDKWAPLSYRYTKVNIMVTFLHRMKLLNYENNVIGAGQTLPRQARPHLLF